VEVKNPQVGQFQNRELAIDNSQFTIEGSRITILVIAPGVSQDDDRRVRQ